MAILRFAIAPETLYQMSWIGPMLQKERSALPLKLLYFAYILRYILSALSDAILNNNA